MVRVPCVQHVAAHVVLAVDVPARAVDVRQRHEHDGDALEDHDRARVDHALIRVLRAVGLELRVIALVEEDKVAVEVAVDRRSPGVVLGIEAELALNRVLVRVDKDGVRLHAFGGVPARRRADGRRARRDELDLGLARRLVVLGYLEYAGRARRVLDVVDDGAQKLVLHVGALARGRLEGEHAVFLVHPQRDLAQPLARRIVLLARVDDEARTSRDEDVAARVLLMIERPQDVAQQQSVSGPGVGCEVDGGGGGGADRCWR